MPFFENLDPFQEHYGYPENVNLRILTEWLYLTQLFFNMSIPQSYLNHPKALLATRF